MDSIIGIVISRLAEVFALALAGTMTTIALRSYKPIIGFLGNKIKSTHNIILQEALLLLKRMVEACVSQAEQTIVKAEKNGNVNKLSPEASERVRYFVTKNVKANMPNNVMELLTKYGIDIDSLIITFIEQAVLEGKKQT